MNNPTKDPNDTIKETVNESTLNQWKDIGNVSGIYKIVNKVNGKYYVGSSKNVFERWERGHRFLLAKGSHYNEYLQNAWNKYGEKNFYLSHIEFVTPSKSCLLETEQKYLDKAKDVPSMCYNLSFNARGGENSWTGKRHTEETRRKMSVSNSGRKVSEKTKQIKSLQNSGRANPNVDLSIYFWENLKTGEKFSGTRLEFRRAHNISANSDSDLIKGISKITLTGWKVNPPNIKVQQSVGRCQPASLQEVVWCI